MLDTKSVAAAIVFRDNKILACERADSQNAGLWEFPGGKIEPGETSEAACVRELAEELSLEPTLMFYFDTVDYDYPTFHLHMDCYVVRIAADATPKLSCHTSYRWLGREELANVRWLPADTHLVQSIGLVWDDMFGDTMY